MKKNILFFAAMGMLLGCSLDDVKQRGDTCPPRNIDNFEQAQLSFIGTQECRADNLGACDITDMADKDINSYFKTKMCPYEYRHCIQDSELQYHCEKDTITKCAEGQILCENNSGNFCLDPSSPKTCGAKSCDDEGQNCEKDNLVCENSSTGYICINKQNNRIMCGEKEIDSSNNSTCGANKCDENDNYGGKNCSELGPESFCAINSQSENYECKCPDSYIVCGGKCINPVTGSQYCGAKGTCSSDDPDNDNYKGEDCSQTEGAFCSEGQCKCPGSYIVCAGKCIDPMTESQYCGAKGTCNNDNPDDDNYKGEDCSQDEGAFCSGGQCKCKDGSFWCIVEGLNNDSPKCYSPAENDTCNAKLMEDGRHCEVVKCEEQFACSYKSDDAYECILNSCQENEQKCFVDNTNICYALTDIHHCGNCSLNCEEHNYLNVVVDKCAKKDDGYACTYKCAEGLTNCGSDTAPNCIDLSSAASHCGTCDNKCEGNTYCKEGTCHETECTNMQCTTKDASGQDICVNNDEQCGPDCAKCTGKHQNGYCLNGNCLIYSCLENEHPIYNNNGQITSCEKNSSTRCAPSNITMGDEIVDCTKKLTENVTETSCTSAGSCLIASCDEGYHISSDLQTCIANSKTECATRNSSEVSDCTAIENSTKTNCESGACAVTECASGYHINKQGNACEANTNTECGLTTSSNTTNCTTLDNIANQDSGTCITSTGKCKVTKCKSMYHIKSDYTACEANTDTACGTTTSTPKNCTSNSLEKVCNSSGKCSCSKNGDTVLNYNGNACVTKWCQGIPGVLSGEKQTINYYSGADEGCKPTECMTGYRLAYEGENERYAYVCRPLTASIDCSTLGYLHATNISGVCVACETNWTNCSSAQCASTHKFYADECLPLDACCGIRNGDRNADYYKCTNCLAFGKKCNASTGKCQ